MSPLEIDHGNCACSRDAAALARGDLKAVKEAQFVCDLRGGANCAWRSPGCSSTRSKQGVQPDAIEGLLRMRLDEVPVGTPSLR